MPKKMSYKGKSMAYKTGAKSGAKAGAKAAKKAGMKGMDYEKGSGYKKKMSKRKY